MSHKTKDMEKIREQERELPVHLCREQSYQLKWRTMAESPNWSHLHIATNLFLHTLKWTMNQEAKVWEMNLTEVERSFTSWETDISSLIYAMHFLDLLFYS